MLGGIFVIIWLFLGIPGIDSHEKGIRPPPAVKRRRGVAGLGGRDSEEAEEREDEEEREWVRREEGHLGVENMEDAAAAASASTLDLIFGE